MGSKSAMVNRPDVYEINTIPFGVQRVNCEMDSRIPNCGTFTIFLEDHTLGNLIRMQLLKDDAVIFASYRMPHPLEHKIEIRIQATEASTPYTALYNALHCIGAQTDTLSKSYRRQVQDSRKNQQRSGQHRS